MNLTVVLFAATAAVVAVSALGVVLSRSVVRAAVWLLFALIGVMLTNHGPFAGIPPKKLEWALGGTVAAGLFVLLVVASFSAARSPTPVADDAPLPGVEELGKGFLGMTETDPRKVDGQPGPYRSTHYLLPFEIVSVHLLVVLVAAAYLARAKRRAAEGAKP